MSMRRFLGAVAALAAAVTLTLIPTAAQAQLSGHWDGRHCGPWHDEARVCVRALEHGTAGHCVTTGVRVLVDVENDSTDTHTVGMNDKGLSFISVWVDNHRVLGAHDLWKRPSGSVWRTFDTANQTSHGVTVLVNDASLHFVAWPDPTDVVSDSHPCS